MPVTPEQQREMNRKYARDYRARKAEARDAARAAGRDSARRAADASGQTMRSSVESSVEAMKWIRPSDRAAIDLALLTADQIDELRLSAEVSVSKLTQLGQLILRVLHELGGTPTVRLQHELRSLRLAAGSVTSEGGDGDIDRERESPNVTSISRPPKRARA